MRLLAAETPASFVAFDLLALGDEDLTGRPFAERRARLERGAGGGRARRCTSRRRRPTGRPPWRWFEEFEGAGLDGVVAKPLTGTYQPDKRVMFKIKHARTADCVVAGYRVHKSGPDLVGSLLLGLYTDDGSLASVGVIGAFPMARRRELFAELQPLVTTFEGHPWNWAADNRIRTARATHGRPRRPAGTPARTSRSCRCGPSSSSRCATTTWRVPGSGTRPSSTAGARTGPRSRAPSTSSSDRSRSSWPTSCPASGRETIAPMRRPGWRPLALLLGGSGLLHLVRPQIYEPLVPRRLGDARAWVVGSGVAEIACAAGLSRSAARGGRAALASAALLVVVFPGNVQHAVSALRSSRASAGVRAGTLARLPVQAPLVAWALRVAPGGGRRMSPAATKGRARLRRTPRSESVGSLGLAAASATGLATYFTRRVVTPLVVKPDDLEILAVHADRVVLGATADTVVPGRYGLWLDGGRGHARIGAILAQDDEAGTVTRALEQVDGAS